MSEHAHSRFDAPERLAIAGAVKRYLNEIGWSRKQLIRHDLSLSTIHKALAGEFSDATLAKIEAILGRSFGPDERKGAAEALKELGGYSLCAVTEMQGTYLCIRPLFGEPEVVTAYLILVRWDDRQSCLCFAEHDRWDTRYTQAGRVHITFGTSFVNFVTVDRGSIRVVMVSQPDNYGFARGLITTLHNPRGMWLIPTSAPVVLKRLEEGEKPRLGLVQPGMPDYETYKALIDSVAAEDYAKFITCVAGTERRMEDRSGLHVAPATVVGAPPGELPHHANVINADGV